MRVHIWGTRGSIATPGPQTIRFGGNTSCVELETDDGDLFILDCGTGIRLLGAKLEAVKKAAISGAILISHAHWDHIQGFPFLSPIFVEGNEFSVYGPGGGDRSLEDILAGQMEYTYFPVDLTQLAATIYYHQLTEGTYPIGAAKVIAQYLHHPAATLGYRIEADGVAVAYLCDHEPFSDILWRCDAPPGRLTSILHDGDRRHAEFMRDADLVIHDAQYTVDEYPSRKNWGHSHYEYVVGVAAAAGVNHLLLTHHDPTHDDSMIEQIEKKARSLAKSLGSSIRVDCAYEGFDLNIAAAKKHKVNNINIDSQKLSLPETVQIIIVDDDPDARDLIEAVLITEGFSVAVAADGGEAIRKARELKPDLLILDLMMPEVDGLEVLKILRSQAETANLKVLVLTASDDEKTIKEGFEKGATDFLNKPFKIPQLTARVRTCLARNVK